MNFGKVVTTVNMTLSDLTPIVIKKVKHPNDHNVCKIHPFPRNYDSLNRNEE